jgi:endonuclease/exonuclease/phosphatase family metal-dependent hydrolase
MKLLQWNIFFKENPHRIAQFIKEQNADFVCLQEVTSGYEHHKRKNIALYLRDRLNYHCYYYPGQIFLNHGEILAIGNAIYSRLPMLDQRAVLLREMHTHTSDFPLEGRIYIEATFKYKKGLTIATTHLAHMPINQRKESNKLHALLQEQDRRSGYILTGDMNAIPKSRLIKKLSSTLVHCGPELSLLTFKDRRLDYVFATPDIKVSSATLVETSYSDHLPIMVEFE